MAAVALFVGGHAGSLWTLAHIMQLVYLANRPRREVVLMEAPAAVAVQAVQEVQAVHSCTLDYKSGNDQVALAIWQMADAQLPNSQRIAKSIMGIVD